MADDYGCFEAEPEIVQVECFKRATNRPVLADVRKCLQMLADENIVGFYNVNNKLYGTFLNWETHQGKPRATHRKYPVQTSVRMCLQMQTDVPVFESVSESVSENEKRENLSDASQGGFLQFWDSYPRKKSKGQAEKAWAKLTPSPTLCETIFAAVERAKVSEEWQKEHGKFIPHPATWLNAKGWEDEVQPTQDWRLKDD